MASLLGKASGSFNIEYGSIPQFVGEEEKTRAPGCTIFETSCNLTSLIVGVGLLSLPFAAKSMGWSATAGLLLLCLIYMYMFKLLAESLEIRHRNRDGNDSEPVDYASLAEDAIGKYGAKIALFFVGTELGLALVLFLMNIGINVNIVNPHISYSAGVIVACLLAFFLTTMSMKYVAYSSMFGLGMTVLTVLAIILSGLLMDQVPTDHTKHYHAIVPSGIPLSMGMMALCFAGHSAFPKIYFSMDDRKQIVSVLSIVSGVVMATYATAMVAGYYFYAQYVLAPVTLNIGRTLTFEDIPQGGTFLRIVAAVGITANLQVTCPLVLFPIRDIALRLCHISHNSRHETIASMLLLGVCLSLALLFQGNFAEVCGLIGSICTTINSVLFPILFYHTIHRNGQISQGKYWLHAVVLAIALSAALSGVISDFCSIFKTYC